MNLIDLLFGTSRDLAWWQECDRALLVFVFGLVAIRVAGRRLFSKWAAPDIVVSVVVGSSLSRALTGSAALFGTLAAITLLIAMHWMLSNAAARWPAVSRLIEGRAVALARGGTVLRASLMRHAVSDADLDEAMRKVSVERVDATQAVMLEPSGNITVVKATAK